VPADTLKRIRESFELMKNQYFGDINDYRKYGLLRALTGMGSISTAVCWMLTPDDGSTDGKFVQYLKDPIRWRHLDPELFDKLREAVVVGGERGVVAAEESKLLPASQLFYEVLPDDSERRRRYFESFWSMAAECDLIFFDPDNGIEVRSKPKGCKGSSKYLYWPELADAYFRGKSVLVYQHFRRSKRDPFISKMAREIADRTGALTIYSFQTASVVFFLLLPESRSRIIEHCISSVDSMWRGQISVQRHLFPERSYQLV
jgi:hypothetical protein